MKIRSSIISVLIIVIICFIPVSCSEKLFYRSGSLGRTEYYDAFAILSADCICELPPEWWGNAPVWDFVELIETDCEGRKLYEYCWGGKRVPKKLVLCQKSENGIAYYYEDYSCMIKNEEGNFSDEELNLIKERNDWNKPLDPGKMLAVECTIEGIDENVDKDYSSTKRDLFYQILKKYSLSDPEISIFIPKETSGEYSFAIVRFRFADNKGKDYKDYIVLYDSSDNTILRSEPYDFREDYQDYIKEFKNYS